MTVVYLAGGMHSDWRSEFVDCMIERFEGKFPADVAVMQRYTFIDPTSHGFLGEETYTAWDLYGVERCDVLLAYMDSENPSGYGLALEVGYAHALGKLIVFVDALNDDRSERFGMVRSAADVVLPSLEDASAFLESLPWLI